METKDTEEKQTVTFEYKISDNFTTYAVSGCHGGLNAQGQIIMNFYHERASIPQLETYEILPGDSLGETPISSSRKNTVIRDVMFSVSFPPQVAPAIAKWLQRNFDLYKSVVSEQSSGEENKQNVE